MPLGARVSAGPRHRYAASVQATPAPICGRTPKFGPAPPPGSVLVFILRRVAGVAAGAGDQFAEVDQFDEGVGLAAQVV